MSLASLIAAPGVRVTVRNLLLPGYMALKNKGRLVWVGRVGAPIEDAVADEIVLSEADYAALLRAIEARAG